MRKHWIENCEFNSSIPQFLNSGHGCQHRCIWRENRLIVAVAPIMHTSKLFDLTGRVALVTGGSRGIGKAIARGFAGAGANVVIASRNDEELANAAAEIEQATGATVAHITTDMTRRADVSALAEKAIGAFGHVDILLNNAGGNKPQPIDQVADEVWDYFLELNLSGCMALARALVPQMKERRWGRIIYASSIFGFTSVAGRSLYCRPRAPCLVGSRKCRRPGPWHHRQLPGARTLRHGIDGCEFQSGGTRPFCQPDGVGTMGETGELVGPALLLASDAGGISPAPRSSSTAARSKTM